MALCRRLERLYELGHAGHGDLVFAALPGRAPQLAKRVELAVQIGLVEIPAAEQRRRAA